MGSGLQMASGTNHDALTLSQKSQRMRQTDYSRGFLSNLDIENGATAEMDPSKVLMHKAGEPGSPSKVFRSWSRPQIASDLPDMPPIVGGREGSGGGFDAAGAGGKVLKPMQVCTCARFRKRIEPPVTDITVQPLTASKASSVADGM